MESLRIGVVGAGAVAQHHLKALASLPNVKIAALASRGEERRLETARTFSIGKTYAASTEMLAHESLDALFVLVSADQVYPVTLECLSAGIPLLIEKPAGLTSHETSDIAARAAAKKIPVMVGYNRRFYSNIKAGLDAVLERGPLLGVTAEIPERIAQVASSGKFSEDMVAKWLILNNTHGIDLLRFLGGSDIAHVSTEARSFRQKTGDNFGATLRFTNGALGHYISHWNTPGSWRVSIYGDGIRADFTTLEIGTLTTAEGSTPISFAQEDIDYKAGFVAQARFFIEHVQNKTAITRPGCSIEDAVETMRLAESIGTLSETPQ